jgi:hypothetical protein
MSGDCDIQITMEFRDSGSPVEIEVDGHPWLIIQDGYGVLTASIRADDDQAEKWIGSIQRASEARLGARWMYHED